MFCRLKKHRRKLCLCGDVTFTGERLKKIRLFWALSACKHRGNFIVPHLVWRRTSVFLIHPKDRRHVVAYYDMQGLLRTPTHRACASMGFVYKLVRSLKIYLVLFFFFAPRVRKFVHRRGCLDRGRVIFSKDSHKIQNWTIAK